MKECPACKRCFADEIAHCPEDGEQVTPSLAGEPVLDGRYQLESRLGQGGMGVVYKARHIFLKTAHAIKVILPDLVGNDPNLATRFRQEAMAAANVRHPNIIAVTDFGIVRGNMPFLVMEFVQGESLHEILQRERILPPARALELMAAIGAGVAAAHRQNIVHRDLKPLNVMLQDGLPVNESVRVLDFGLAKIKSGEILGSFVAAQTSGLMGSPFYMAPEQWSDEEPDARADIYSLAVITYQMLAGEVPFKGASIPSIMRKHLTEAPPPMNSLGAEVPIEIEAAVRRALEKDPASRPATVEMFLTELRTAVKGTADLSRTQLDFGKHTDPDLAPHTGAFDPNQTQISSSDLGAVSGASSLPPIDRESLSKMPEAIEAQRLREQAAILEERARQSAELQRLELDRQAREEEAKQLSGQVETVVETPAKVSAKLPEPPAIALVPDVPVDADGEWINFGSTDPGRAGLNTQAIPPAEIAEKVAPAVVPVPAPISVPRKPSPRPPAVSPPARPAAAPAKRSSKAPLIAIGAVLLVLVTLAGGFGAYRFLRSRAVGGQQFPTPTPTPPPPPTPTPKQYLADLAVIPGGKFTMGSNEGAVQEEPAHAERVATFSMDKTEVTNGEYALFVAATNYPPPSHFLNGKPRPGEEDFPVVYVNVDDAEAFARWRSGRDGVTYRLPTEIEWEYAARSGAKNFKYPWGNNWEANRAVTKASGATGLANVNSHPEGDNIWGVADLIGNVREWTSSKVSFYPGNNGIEPELKRRALDLGADSRVVRGSSYEAPVKVDHELTASFRDWFPASERRAYFGFRLVTSGELAKSSQ